jgi:hypothetical protein
MFNSNYVWDLKIVRNREVSAQEGCPFREVSLYMFSIRSDPRLYKWRPDQIRLMEDSCRCSSLVYVLYLKLVKVKARYPHKYSPGWTKEKYEKRSG